MMPPRFVRRYADANRLFAHLADLDREVLAFAYLAADGRVIGVRHTVSPYPTRVRLPIRAVARDVIRLDAARVVMAHNHPLGDPRPSRADLAATRRLAVGLAALGVRLVEHLVLTGAGRSFSLRRAGLL